MKAKTKFTRLWSILLVLVMVVGMLPTVALAEEPDAFLQFADAPGEFFYRKDGGHNSEGPTEDTTFTLTEPTMITGIWTYHWYAANYDIDFSRQTIQLKDTNTDTVVYSGAVRVGHHANTIDCDWIVLPNIVLPAGTYQVIDSHNESWSALNGKGVCIVKGYSGAPSSTALFSTSPIGALALLNNAKTGTEDSEWNSSTKTLTLNGVNFETTAATAVRLPADSTIVLNGVNTIKGGNSDSDDCYGIEGLGNLTIQGTGTLNVTGGTATNGDSYGIYAKKDVTISGGTVNATGGTATDDSHGIYAKGSIAISGGTVTANGGKATDESYGIYTKGNITITDGTVTANGGEAGDSYGIYASGRDEDYIGVKISGGATVNATGGEATNGDSYGINAYHKVNIAGGTVNANGGTATNHSFGIYADDDVNIAGGTVNANGGTATNNSYGIYAHYKVNIAGGTLIAKVTSGNGTANALNKAPKTLPDTYWWRTSNSGAYHKYPASAYIWDTAHTYFEIQKPGYTVTFDANGGSGEMTGADVVSGEYTLPANGFTAPEGKRFKAWSVNGTEKAVGDKITVSADTTVKAVWENITYTVSFDANDGSGTMANVTGVLGDYTLPKNGFTAPDGKQFKAWSVDGKEKAVGDKIAVAADTTVKAVWENIPAAPTEYDILDGANSSWTQDSDGSLSVRGSGEFSKFVGVKVDGKSVDEKNYTVKEGSTIVTLKAGYLNTLTVGSHTLEIIWTDGSASTAFSVNAKSPQTGDNSMMALWIAVLFVSGIGVMGTTIYIRKKKYSVK